MIFTCWTWFRRVRVPEPAAATNLLVYLGHGATLVGGPFGQPVLLAFTQRRLFAVVTLTVRESLVLTIEATADPAARAL